MNKRLRKKLYDKLLDLSRQLLDVWLAIGNELERQGTGAGEPLHRAVTIVDKALWDLIEDWEDGQLAAEPPEPQTKLEHLLQEHHRLLWAAQNLCDEIEKKFGEVSPLLDLRGFKRPKLV